MRRTLRTLVLAGAALLAANQPPPGAASSPRLVGLAAEFHAEPEEGPPSTCVLDLRSDIPAGEPTPRAAIVLGRSGASVRGDGITPVDPVDGAALYAALLRGDRVALTSRDVPDHGVHRRAARFDFSSRCAQGRCNAFAECRAAAVCARMLGHELPEAAGACGSQPHDCRGMGDARFTATDRELLRRAALFAGGLRWPESACFSIAEAPGGKGRLVHVSQGRPGAGVPVTVQTDTAGQPMRLHFAPPRDAAQLSDVPSDDARPVLDFRPAPDYGSALSTWRGPADVNGWIAKHFEYDRARALRLSETQRAKTGATILTPAEFFAAPRGVCVDLSRFAVETLRAVDPASKPAFLMIEFEPTTIAGNTLRLHWLASYRRDGLYYFFADSKRPGDVAGPYPSVEAFIADYELYRGRKVVRWRELESYERKTRARAVRQERSDAGAKGEPR